MHPIPLCFNLAWLCYQFLVMTSGITWYHYHNSCRAVTISGYIKNTFPFWSILKISMAHISEICSRGRQEPIHLHGQSRGCQWWCKELGYQQAWYRPIYLRTLRIQHVKSYPQWKRCIPKRHLHMGFGPWKSYDGQPGDIWTNGAITVSDFLYLFRPN